MWVSKPTPSSDLSGTQNKMAFTATWSKLTGLQVKDDGIEGLYKPVFSFERRAGQSYLEIHWSTQQSTVLLFDRYGIHARNYDVRE